MANTKVPSELVSNQVFGRRNLIINGDMKVAQRATSATVGPNGTGEGYQTLDRWNHGLNNAAVTTVSQSSTVPTGEGFANSMKIDVTTADTSVASTDFWIMTTKLEGQDLQRIKKGTSNAEKLTLSFWVRSTKTGVYVVELEDKDNATRSVSLSYTISSADTWQKVELVFPADTTGAFTNDNNESLRIDWWLSAGTTYSSGTLNTTWASQTNANRAVGQVNWMDSTSNDFYLTGVQLEVGDNATPFEHLSYGEELALCERYLEVCRSGDDGYCGIWGSELNTSTNWWTGWQFRQEKRAKPTFFLGNGCAWTKGGTAENVYEGLSHINFQSNDYFYFSGNTEGTAGMFAEAEL